jgi:hypothetical protein
MSYLGDIVPEAKRVVGARRAEGGDGLKKMAEYGTNYYRKGIFCKKDSRRILTHADRQSRNISQFG